MSHNNDCANGLALQLYINTVVRIKIYITKQNCKYITNAYVYIIGSHKALKAIGDEPKEKNIHE